MLAELKGHTGPVWSVAFAPDGRTLAAGDGGGAVRFWDVAAGRERQRFAWDVGPVQALAFAPDGLTCAAGGATGRVVLWDVDA